MQKYHYEINPQHGLHIARRTKKMVVAIFICIALIGVIILIDYIRSVIDSGPKVSTENKSVQAANINVFRSEYFQFQAGDRWREISSDNINRKYTYRMYDGTLVEKELEIRVNNTEVVALPNVRTSRVFPVTVLYGNKLLAESAVSDHCKKYLPATNNVDPQIVTVEQVKFACNPDSTSYQVVVGEIGKTDNILLTRPGEKEAVYNIIFRDYTFNPDTNELRQIIETFETR